MPIIIGILLVLGVGGGTVAVSGSAVPGDALFPVERIVEKTQLAFSGKEKDIELKAKFAEERIDEVEELLSKRLKDTDESDDVSDDEYDTDYTDDEDDKDEYVKKSDENIEEGLSLAIELLDGNDAQYAGLISRLNELLTDLPDDSEYNIKLSDNGASFVKFKEEDDGSSKFEFEVKELNGEKVLVKQRVEGNKVEVEMENEDGKFKLKIEDDGRVKIEQEDSDEDSDDDIDEIDDDSDDDGIDEDDEDSDDDIDEIDEDSDEEELEDEDDEELEVEEEDNL
jgi:hypothetical protein